MKLDQRVLMVMIISVAPTLSADCKQFGPDPL